MIDVDIRETIPQPVEEVFRRISDIDRHRTPRHGFRGGTASCSVGDLGQLVAVAPSTLSHHLKELEAAGVIERVRDGRYLYCRAKQAVLDQLAALLNGSKPGEERAA